MSLFKSALCVIVALIAPPVFAAPILTFNFTGSVTAVEFAVPGAPNVGDMVSGSISYDLATPDSDLRLYSGRYQQTLANPLVIVVGGETYNFSDSLYTAVTTFSGFGSPPDPNEFGFDGFTVGAQKIVGAGPNRLNGGIWFQVYQDVVSSDGLPLNLDLSAIYPNFVGAVYLWDARDQDIWRVDFKLQSLTREAPEPATLALFALGLAGLGFSRRKKA